MSLFYTQDDIIIVISKYVDNNYVLTEFSKFKLKSNDIVIFTVLYYNTIPSTKDIL